MMTQSLIQKRIVVFRRNRRARISLIVLLCLFGVSLLGELIANDKPILVLYQGRLLIPIAKTYTEKDTFGGVLESEADYSDPWIQEKIQSNGWMVMPLLTYHHQTVDFTAARAPAAPNIAHPLGTDDQGRDVLVRILYGFRLSLCFALILVSISSVIGVTLGALQGYYGGLFDLLFQRFIELWHSVPLLFLLIILSSIMVPDFWSILILMLLFSWMALVDVVRAEFLRARNFDYVRAAKALGVGEFTIIFRHVLPNALVSVFTFVPFLITGAITTLASLDFLGFGLPSGAPSLGELLQQGKNNPQSPWLGLSGFGILALLLSLLIFIGEGVRDAFNPRKIMARDEEEPS
jgi:microcin C transport system permease protein